ncbi:LexA family transcriptional regulator [Aureimonas fodinaquatilis]|uniref:LexA family transcriptional regulator n=1 Tax=Aureimonas fodinaquatilis TaxID=2565783 RepID=A0A5B0E037_9HYPH|nr:LexA family transcriptional regulator [Aureimonas fodinaquatilis]KAA0970839.1 LexA family transcriptional regulator [Aureimonas fodinaquatilis]
MANQVRKLRKDREMTLERLSELTGISTSFLSRIEKGDRGLSLENLVKIAKVLKVEPLEVSNDFHEEDLEHAASFPVADTEKGDIPNLTIYGGMGLGSTLTVTANDQGEIYSEHIDGFWSFPPAVKAGWRHMKSIHALPVIGDSMEPTLASGSFVFIDTTHVVPSPADLYALDYGDGLVIKRVKLIPRSDKIQIISDNPAYGADELSRGDVRVYGRVVAWFQWRG